MHMFRNFDPPFCFQLLSPLGFLRFRSCKMHFIFSQKTTFGSIKDVRAYCYCASLVRTLFIGHARATSFFKRAHRVENSTKYRADDLCVNLVCEYFCWTLGDPHFFFRQIASFSDSFHYTKKQKKISAWEVSIISHILFKKGRIGSWIQVCVT